MRDQEKVAKPPQLAQTGWCGQELLDHTTPSAPSKEASLLLLDVASTPPPAEEGSRLLQLVLGGPFHAFNHQNFGV